MPPATYKVLQSSVVLLSPSPIDPQSIAPEALSRSEVTPSSWVLTGNVNTPVFATVQYQNGVTIQVADSRCIIQKAVDNIRDTDSSVYGLAERYAAATKLVPYSAVGINWRLSISGEHLEDWVREKLVGGLGAFGDFSARSVQLVKQLDFTACNLQFQVESAQVTLNCNYHFPTKERSYTEIESMLKSWPKCRDHLSEAILPKLRS